MMFYLTFNDSPSGVYYSQVIETVKYLNTLNQEKVKLIAVIPVRNFNVNKKILQSWFPGIRVLPLPIKLKYWKIYKIILRLIPGITKERIIARGPLACSIALMLNNEVIYDGRAAVSAELDEFPEMVLDKNLVVEIKNAERAAVLNSKFRIAVSHKLVDYWREKFGYSKANHIVIPCLISDHNAINSIDVSRECLGFNENDVVLIFSGGTGGWQSSELLMEFLEKQLSKENTKLLLLTKETTEFLNLKKQFKDKVVIKWVEPEEVSAYLKLGDYGILVRDQIITNKVSSPVKFAEYLSAGLSVLITLNLGDYTELVEQNKLGYVIDIDADIMLGRVETETKKKISDFAKREFHRNKFKLEFLGLFTNKKAEN